MHGDISYNGRGLHEFVPQRTASYVSQVDDHIGEMTVRETFDFSVRPAAAWAHDALVMGHSIMRRDMSNLCMHAFSACLNCICPGMLIYVLMCLWLSAGTLPGRCK